jgi:hypothetical protein
LPFIFRFLPAFASSLLSTAHCFWGKYETKIEAVDMLRLAPCTLVLLLEQFSASG